MLLPTIGSQPQQFIERVTEALEIEALNPFTSTILLHDYLTRQHDTPVSALTTKGYIDIDYPTRQRNTQSTHPIIKYLNEIHAMKPYQDIPFSNTLPPSKADTISLYSYYTRPNKNPISVHSQPSYATHPHNDNNSYTECPRTPNLNTIDIEPVRVPHIL